MEGFEDEAIVVVVVADAVTARVPVAVTVPPLHPCPPGALGAVADTVKFDEPPGVVLVVLMVKVEFTAMLPVPPVTEDELNENVAPAGNAVVIVRLAVQLPLPLKSTVTG